MISLKKLLVEALLLEVTFQWLYDQTDAGRKARAKSVTARSNRIVSVGNDGAESTDSSHRMGAAWIFNYKTSNNDSTTGTRYHGTILFPKESLRGNVVNIGGLDCKVHCDCPDYFNRRQYANWKIGAGLMKPGIVKGKEVRHNRQAPNPNAWQKTDIGPGLCKHLVALADFLIQSIDAPNPEDEIPQFGSATDKEMEPRPADASATINAPNPDTTYTNQSSKPKYRSLRKTPVAPKPPVEPTSPTAPVSTTEPKVPEPEPEPEKPRKTYSDTGLEEGNDLQSIPLYQKMEALVAKMRNFEIPYED